MLPHSTPETEANSPREMIVTRTVNAKRSLVWRLWTESRHLAAWWGPHCFTNPECAIDPRPGGQLRIVMRAPNGEEFVNVGTVRSVNPPKRLVFTLTLLNADGSPRLENLTTVDLVDGGDSTQVTMRVQVLYATEEAHENMAGMNDGWSQSLERLSNLGAKETAQ